MGLFGKSKNKASTSTTPPRKGLGRPPKTPGTASTVASASSQDPTLSSVQKNLMNDLNVLNDDSSEMLEVVIGQVPKAAAAAPSTNPEAGSASPLHKQPTGKSSDQAAKASGASNDSQAVELSPDIELSNEHDVQLDEDEEMTRKRNELAEQRRLEEEKRRRESDQKRLAATASEPLEPSIERVKSTDSVPPMAAPAVAPPSPIKKQDDNLDVTGTPVRARSLGTGFTLPAAKKEEPSPQRVETIAKDGKADVVVEEDAPPALVPATPDRTITTEDGGSPDSRGSVVAEKPEALESAVPKPSGSPMSRLTERIRSGMTKEKVTETLKTAIQCAPGIASEIKKQVTACTPDLAKATLEETVPLKRASSKFDAKFANDFLDVSIVIHIDRSFEVQCSAVS
jgi:hypothetical protein